MLPACAAGDRVTHSFFATNEGTEARTLEVLSLLALLVQKNSTKTDSWLCRLGVGAEAERPQFTCLTSTKKNADSWLCRLGVGAEAERPEAQPCRCDRCARQDDPFQPRLLPCGDGACGSRTGVSVCTFVLGLLAVLVQSANTDT